ncbi:cytoskeleton-associated protein [Ophiocordyceps camponoti-floridani]|uniref:Cytoskeleton-associated protein n=1 Tax=Ophiocordyceps camponoti-floridani TaxID=2030778 RepID=A0A8H4QC62_9HYPO|nr:cytoskeleton-associated protein [Ophiocordyceps camponoti-floridani]
MAWTDSFWAVARDERVILLSMGLAAFGLVSAMMTGLTLIRDANEIAATEPKTQYITQDTEDALQLETLEKLLKHPSYPIQEVATKILCDRAMNDSDTTTYLLYGITRPNYEERMQCLRALALLTTQTIGVDGLSKLNNARAMSALVRSLELSLQDVELPDLSNSHWDEYYLRDMAERFCLMFVQELVNKYGAEPLIKAQFVERWLVKQRWGTTAEERRRRFAEYMNSKSNRLVDIVSSIKHLKRGLRALRKVGLIEETHPPRQMARSLPDLGIEDEVGERLRRAREHNDEERRLRRQHREAMRFLVVVCQLIKDRSSLNREEKGGAPVPAIL